MIVMLKKYLKLKYILQVQEKSALAYAWAHFRRGYGMGNCNGGCSGHRALPQKSPTS